MRFLVDNNLPPGFAAGLRRAGHDAVHVREIGPADALDEELFELAAQQQRVLVAQDTDFAMLLALRDATRPSLVLFRRRAKAVAALLPLLLTHLPTISADLEAGAVVVFEDWRIRVRRLPFASCAAD